MAVEPTKKLNSLVQDRTIGEITKESGISPTRDQWGAVFTSSIQQGFGNNITGTLIDFAKTEIKGIGEEPITEEEFNAMHAPSLGIKYKNQTKSQTKYLIHRAAKKIHDESVANRSGVEPLKFAGNIVGAFADPVAIGLGLGIGKNAKVSAAISAGKFGSKSAQAVRAKAGVILGAQTTRQLMAYNVALEAPYMFMKEEMGDTYTDQQFATAMMLNPVFSTFFGGLRGYQATRLRGKVDKINAKFENLERHMTGQKGSFDSGDVTVKTDKNGNPIITKIGDTPIMEEVNIARDNGGDTIAKIIKKDSRLKDIADGRVKEEDLTFNDVGRILSLMHLAETSRVINNITGRLSNSYFEELEKGGSIRDANKAFKARHTRISEAILTKDISKLTPDDIAIIRAEYPNKPNVDLVQLLDSEGSKRAAYEASYQQNQANPQAATQVDSLITTYTQNNVIVKGDKKFPVKMTEQLNTVNNLMKAEYDAIVGTSPLVQVRNDMVGYTQDVINKYLLGKKSNVVFEQEHPLDYHAKHNMAKGAYNYVEGKMAIGPAPVFGVRNYASQIINTGMHEYVHHLRYIPQAAQLQNIANQVAKKDPTLDVEINRRGYKLQNLIEERAPVLMEWAISRPEFWNTLAKKDAKLHKQLDKSLTEYMKQLRDYLNTDSPNLVKGLDDLQSKTPIAERVAETIQKIKNDSDSVNIFKNINELNKQHLGKDTVEQMASPAYENPIYKKRVSELERFNADPKQYYTDEIITTLGDETILPTIQSMPKISAGEAGRKEHIARVQEALNEKGFDNLSSKYETILLNLQGSSARLAKVRKIIRQDPSSQNFLDNLTALQEAGMPPEILSRVGSILLDGNLTAAQKLGKVNTFFEQEDLAMVLRFVHNDAIRTSLGTQAKIGSGKKARLDQLKTMLDGSLRADVTRGPSVEKLIEAQIKRDQAPLADYVTQNNLDEVFFAEPYYKWMSRYLGKRTDSDGVPYKEASLNLHRDIMRSIMAGEPKGIIKSAPELEGLVDVITTITRGQLSDLVRLGINMRESKNFTGYSVLYDKQLVASMKTDDFVTYMMNAVDLQETARLHGGVMNKYTEGVLDGFQEFAPRPFFKRMHEEIVNGTFIDDGDTANKSIAGAMRKSSKIAFKEETKIEALIKFSNYEDLARVLFEQIRSRAEKIALIKNLGHDPYTMLMDVARDLKVTKTPGFKTFDMTAKQISGVLDNPVDAVFAKNFQKLRTVSNIMYLPTASLSALSDIPLTMTTLDYIGAKVPFSQFMKTYANAFDMIFKGNKKELNSWFRAQGAGFDLLTRTMGQRVVTGESLAGGLVGATNQLQFELFALNPVTALHQVMFLDIVSSKMAAELKTMTKGSVLLARMREYGFTTAELNQLAKHAVETPDGIERVAPSNIPNVKTQDKLRAFYLQYMKEAVMEPDVGARAMSRLGFEAGTAKGEAARTAFQYSSFMLGMSRVVYRRFAHGYSGEGKHNAKGMSHLVAYLGAAIGFAYITTVLKDLSRGKEPIDITNMTQFDFNRIISQSGILGIGDLAFNAVRFKDPMAMFSPLAGQAVDLATGDLESFLKPFTGQQYPIISPIMQQMIGQVAGETINAVQSDMEESISSLSDRQLKREISQQERKGNLKLVRTPKGSQVLATTKESVMLAEELKSRQ